MALAGPSAWPASLQFLQSGSDDEFRDFVKPLADMTRLTYTATWGSYYKEAEANATVEGWQRTPLQANPTAGMRALTFLQPSSGRGVIAFRGTDLNPSGESGQADMCADAVLAGSTPSPQCSRFSDRTLDYLARAVEFTEAAVQRHPDIDWLFTGHSLGAQLAEVLAAQRGARALGFAAPPVVAVLENRTTIDPGSVGPWSSVALFNEWDPLRYESRGKLVGAACAWAVSPAPLGCETCDLDGPPDTSRPSCLLCFRETHVFAKYLSLVSSGRRPSCAPAAPLSEPPAEEASARVPAFV